MFEIFVMVPSAGLEPARQKRPRILRPMLQAISAIAGIIGQYKSIRLTSESI